MNSPSDEPELARPRDYFNGTQWTQVLNAGRNDSTGAREALEELCRTYWYPLYAFARRLGQSPPGRGGLGQEAEVSLKTG